MTKEEKIKEIISNCNEYTNTEYWDDKAIDILDEEKAVQEILNWHESELAKQREEILEQIKDKVINTHPDRNISRSRWNDGFRAISNIPVEVVELTDILNILQPKGGEDE